jgi:hypothetical protein
MLTSIEGVLTGHNEALTHPLTCDYQQGPHVEAKDHLHSKYLFSVLVARDLISGLWRLSVGIDLVGAYKRLAYRQ